MSRPVKFRAWSDGESQMLDMYQMRDFRFSEIESAESLGYRLMQYTGVKDKNGVEIYEGDIVKLGAGFILRQVVFEEGCWFAKDVDGAYIDQRRRYRVLYDKAKTIEVIGNIYENPDLISNNISNKEN